MLARHATGVQQQVLLPVQRQVADHRANDADVIDHSGEVFEARGCTLNLIDSGAGRAPEVRWHFREVFGREIEIFGRFTRGLLGDSCREWDTFVPLALLVDFATLTPGADRPGEELDEEPRDI